MTGRLTPEQIASTYKGGVKVLRRLEQYGYVIVHPGDVPEVNLDPEWFYGECSPKQPRRRWFRKSRNEEAK